MSIGGRTFRAFRPSCYAQMDHLEEEEGDGKQDNIRLYAQRARAGLPLFDSSKAAKNIAAAPKLSMI